MRAEPLPAPSARNPSPADSIFTNRYGTVTEVEFEGGLSTPSLSTLFTT